MLTLPACLPATGAEQAIPAIPVLIGLLLLLAGAAVLVLRRRGRRSGLALGLALALVVGAGVAGITVTPSPAVAADCPTIEEDAPVAFMSGEVTVFGSYRGPIDPSRPVAAAVIVGGTGAVDRDGNAAGILMEEYEWLAGLLAEQGIASLRYDKLGTGETGLGPYAADPDQLLSRSYDELRIQPARDALSFLASQPGIDPTRLLLIGHSEGGGVTISVAADPGSAPAPAGLLLIEPLYDRILDVIPRQFVEQIDAAVAGSAMTAPDADALKAWLADGVDEIRTGTPPYPAPGPVPLPGATDYTAVMQSTIESNIYGSDPAQMVVSHAYRTRYGQEFDEIEPGAIAPSITIPVLITCGTKDFNTPCDDGSGSGVAQLAAQFAPGVARFVELQDVVHILRDVGDADVPSLADQIAYPFSPALAAEFTAFVAQFRD
jgi:LPXTG-motif cell wall-anchored protein